MALSELEIDVITPDVIKGSLSTIIKEPEDLEKLSDDVVEKIIGRISRDLEK